MDDNIVVLIEDTTLKLQRLLSTMVNDRIKRDIIGTEAKRIINECIKKLNEANCPKEFIEKQRQAFMSTFTNWYMQITTNLAKLAQKTKNPTFYQSYKEITGIEPKISGKSIVINVGAKSDYGDNMELGGVKNIRDYFTTGETGYSQMFVEDYQKRVNREIMKIASMNVVLVNRKGKTMSARNLAEMQVRFEEQVKDFDKLDKKGVKFVVATSHSNASERCQPWQGKIFELDAKVGDVTIGKEIQHGEPTPKGKMPNGKNYYSLKEAMEKGFLGYNCRHRIVEYKSGMVMPKQYTENQINKERNIEQTARSLERQIRNAKKKSMLANNSLDRKKYQEESKKLQDTYWDYCKEHDYPVAEWRTRVALNEREGLKSGSISNVPNDNNKGVKYQTGSLLKIDEDLKLNESIEREEEIVIADEVNINPIVKTKEYRNILKSHFKDKKIGQAVANAARKLFGTGKAKRVEGICLINKHKLNRDFYNANGNPQSTILGPKGEKFLQELNEGILIHNHRGNTPPSYADLEACARRAKYEGKNIEYLILTNDGKIYYYKDVDIINQKKYNELVSGDTPLELEKGMFKLAKRYNFTFERWR